MLQISPYTVEVDLEITLRIRTADEALMLFNLIQKNKRHLGKFLTWVKDTKTLSDTERFISGKLIEFNNQTNCDFGIYFKDEMVGSGGYIKFDSKNKSGEIGYWISKDFEGQGIITKIVSKLIEIGKEKYNLDCIEIKMLSHNKKSKAIPIRLGFLHGNTIEAGAFRNGRFYDVEVWTLKL